jgi:CheY-like chemotaxis protein
LGLAIVKKYVTFLKGNINVRTINGDDTTFTVRLPIEPDDILSVVGAKPMRRILYVEDDAIIRMLMKKSLQNYEVDVAENVKSAMALLNTCHYDAIFLDINLGNGESGFDLCRHIRNELKLTDIPIAAVTAMGMDSEHTLFDIGFTHYMPNPFDRDQIIRLVNSMAANE